MPYVAIQIRGVAIFLEQAFPAALPVWGWSLMIVVIMLMYSEFGGLKAIIYADFMQGTMLLIVVWVIATTCLNYLGGWAEMFAQVELANPKLLSTPGPKGLLNAYKNIYPPQEQHRTKMRYIYKAMTDEDKWSEGDIISLPPGLCFGGVTPRYFKSSNPETQDRIKEYETQGWI